MKKRLCFIFLILCCLLLPVLMPVFWKKWISLPLLKLLRSIGGCIRFSILEYSVMLLCGILLFTLVKNSFQGGTAYALRRLFCQITRVMLVILMMLSAMWLPLYESAADFNPASARRLKSCAIELVLQINNSDGDFTPLPDNLPAKFIRFPFWMRLLNISGFYSFLTGEAFISPDQSAAAIPFVAVHEAVHGQGIANEGSCNITAYEECIRLGGAYALSARLWALRYVLSELREADYAAYAEVYYQMNPRCYTLFNEVGGVYQKPERGGVQAVFSRIAGASVSDYEILAHHLAAKMSG